MIPAFRLAAAMLLLAAALPAVAFVRETTTPGQPQTGLCLWWRARQKTYRVNATSASPTPCQDAARAEAAAAAGLAAWSSATRSGEASPCTDFAFVQGPPTTQTALGNDGTNLVVFRTGRCSEVVGQDPCARTPGACAAKFNCWEHEFGTIGLTTTTFDLETGELLDADMELFAWDGSTPPSGSYFTCEDASAPRCADPPYGRTGCSWVDVAAVVTHEAGHMFGLDHVCSGMFPPPYDACPSGSPVMAPTVGDVARRVLSPDDVEGVCTLYPAGGSTLTCLPGGEVPSESSSGGGCASAGGVGIAGLLGALWALRRARKRGGRP